MTKQPAPGTAQAAARRLTIVVPMAGRGERFARLGYAKPKPLLPVLGHEMIRLVIANLRPASHPHRFVFVCLQEHLERYPLATMLATWAPDARIVTVPGITSGAAATVLAAREHLASDDPLMIANCDQLVDLPIDRYLDRLTHDDLDGLIMTMPADDPKWSFVRRGPSGLVDEVAEKRVISREATVGIYNFKRGSDFCRAADAMIAKRIRTNGEYYVAPVYNEMIRTGMRIGAYELHPPAAMYGIGTPEDLAAFEREGAGKALVARLVRA
jgi:NDP-sugar pyrophosphorylase family protein